MFVERLKEMDEQKYTNIVISLIMVCNVYSGKKAKILKILKIIMGLICTDCGCVFELYHLHLGDPKFKEMQEEDSFLLWVFRMQEESSGVLF